MIKQDIKPLELTYSLLKRLFAVIHESRIPNEKLVPTYWLPGTGSSGLSLLELSLWKRQLPRSWNLQINSTLNRRGGGIRPQAGSSLCCAETVESRKLKLSDFYYILIGFHFEYKPVPWDIHCCHGNVIVEECLV